METVIFWVIFKTLAFLNKTTDLDAVWTIIELNLLALGWWKELWLKCTATLLYRVETKRVLGSSPINILWLKKYRFIQKMRHSSAQSRIKAVALNCHFKLHVDPILCVA